MEGLQPMRIVLLGKTGAGKSSTANTIFGDEVFPVNNPFKSETKKSEKKTKELNGRSVTLMDTPGIFDNEMPESELRSEITRCLIESAPGPHAFLIVLKLERFTQHGHDVIQKIFEYLSEDVLKYAVVVFTHGDQLAEGQQINELINQNKDVHDLVKKCGNRCHIVDNKYWNNKPKEDPRSNLFNVEALLETISTMMTTNNKYYTNDLVRAVDEETKQECDNISLLSENMPESKLRRQAKKKFFKKLITKLAGIATGALCGAFFGVVVMVGIVLTALRKNSEQVELREAAAKISFYILGAGVGVGGIAGLAGVAGAAGAAGTAGAFLMTPALVSAAAGLVAGGYAGYVAAESAETPREAAQMAAEAVKEKAQKILNKTNHYIDKIFKIKSKIPK